MDEKCSSLIRVQQGDSTKQPAMPELADERSGVRPNETLWKPKK